jgi:hypothetical protein
MRYAITVAAFTLALSGWAQTLKVGDPAPTLPVAKWVKGQPVKEFEQGKVYVVEFWGDLVRSVPTDHPPPNQTRREIQG